MLQIKKQLTANKKSKPDENSLGFGVYYTDHMLIIDHDEEQGWHDARIVPYEPLSDRSCSHGPALRDGVVRGHESLPHARWFDPTVPPGQRMRSA